MRSETAEAVEPGLNDLQGGTACPLLIACGQPSQERSPLPLLTVLLLLTGERLEEVGGVKNERDGTSGVWALQGSFFGRRVLVLALGYSEVFFARVYRRSGRLAATADYNHSATPPIHQEAIEQSQMRRKLNAKSGVSS